MRHGYDRDICVKCELYKGPVRTDLDSADENARRTYCGEDCTLKRNVRTEKGAFVSCVKDMEKFGPKTAYGTPGWYPERGD